MHAFPRVCKHMLYLLCWQCLLTCIVASITGSTGMAVSPGPPPVKKSTSFSLSHAVRLPAARQEQGLCQSLMPTRERYKCKSLFIMAPSITLLQLLCYRETRRQKQTRPMQDTDVPVNGDSRASVLSMRAFGFASSTSVVVLAYKRRQAGQDANTCRVQLCVSSQCMQLMHCGRAAQCRSACSLTPCCCPLLIAACTCNVDGCMIMGTAYPIRHLHVCFFWSTNSAPTTTSGSYHIRLVLQHTGRRGSTCSILSLAYLASLCCFKLPAEPGCLLFCCSQSSKHVLTYRPL